MTWWDATPSSAIPHYQSGKYYDYGCQPSVGLAIARMLGHITYLSREAMMQKFDAQRLDARGVQTQFETKFAVGSYLAYQGDRFVERFDANSYLTLTMAIDLFDLGSDAAALSQALGASQCRWLAAELLQRLAVPVVPVARAAGSHGGDGQVGQLLRYPDRLRT